MAPPWTTIALALLALTNTPALAQEPASSRPVSEAVSEAASDSPTAERPTPRIRVAILRSDDFTPRAELERAIRLRLPGVTLVSDGEPVPAAEDGSLRAFIDLRQDDTQLLLTLILADGRAYLRPLELDADAPARPVASALANLVAAIDDDTAVPDKQDVPVPAALLAPPPQPVPKDIPAPAPVVLPPPPPTPAPRWHLSPLLRPVATVGLAPPGLRGAGAGLGLDALAPSGLLLTADLQWLTRALGPLHLHRLRVSLGVGYTLRRNNFELPVAAMLGVETWRLGDGRGKVPLSSVGPINTAPDGSPLLAPTASPAPLLGLGLRLSPGYSAPVGRRGARLRVGARVELWSSGQPGPGPGLRRPVLKLPTGDATLGGLELNLGLEVGVWFPVGPAPKRRSKRPGP